MANQEIVFLKTTQIAPHPDNPRQHSKSQIQAIMRSIESFGFRYPVLVDRHNRLISGHGRLEAARLLEMSQVPAPRAEELSAAQVRALMIADNRIAELSTWDDDLLAENFEFLLNKDLDFEIEAIGFDYGDIEVRASERTGDKSDTPARPEPPVLDLKVVQRAQPGDVWALGDHRVICGDAMNAEAYAALLGEQRADVVFTDPPYNLKPSDIGKTCATEHGAFAMGSGEMSREDFTQFLTEAFDLMRTYASRDATVFTCMDWRHLVELQAAGEAVFTNLRNVCVWSKDRAGMGSFYRSQHEFVFVWQASDGLSQNNIQLGKNGRNRSNVWEYPSALSFKTDAGELANATHFHPTVKPVALVADALLVVSRKGDIVLDPFLGSGSTLMAAERVGRRAYGIEIDPSYIDLVLARWEAGTGLEATCLVQGGLSDV